MANAEHEAVAFDPPWTFPRRRAGGLHDGLISRQVGCRSATALTPAKARWRLKMPTPQGPLYINGG